MRARWLDVGRVRPVELHAWSQGLAEAQPPDAEPIVLWARCDAPHVSLGASQRADAEVDLAACAGAGVEVLRRPLGGGTVLVDPDQWCLFFVLPRASASRGREAFLDACMTPLAVCLERLGVAATRVGRTDLWVGGRKILGSGVATLGESHLFGASFLQRFDAVTFARLVRCPSEDFRDWLVDALRDGMTDLAREGCAPGHDEIRAAFASALEHTFEWTLVDDSPNAAERRAADEAQAEVRDVAGGAPRRQVRDGIKINERLFLIEREHAGEGVRMVIRDGCIERLALWPEAGAAQACRGMRVEREALQRALEAVTDEATAARCAERIARAGAGG